MLRRRRTLPRISFSACPSQTSGLSLRDSFVFHVGLQHCGGRLGSGMVGLDGRSGNKDGAGGHGVGASRNTAGQQKEKGDQEGDG